METVLEYITVGLLIIVLVIAANQMMSASLGTVVTVREEQLYTVAQRIMDKILLTPGYPADWGTNITVSADDMQDFGLALNGTRAPYIVDPDKVMRLANLSTLPNPLLLNSSRLADLLGLRGTYGFRLVMKPMIVHDIQPLDWYQPKGSSQNFAVKFRVRVANWYGLGLPNANVTGIYVIVKVDPGAGGTGPQLEEKKIFTKSNVTGALGETILDFTNVVQQYLSTQKVNKWFFSFVVIHTVWHGFVAVYGYTSLAEGSAPLQGYIIGDAIILSRDLNVTWVPKKSGAVIFKDEVVQLVPQYEGLLNITGITWCRSQPSDPIWCQQVAGKVLPSSPGRYVIGRIQYVEKLSSHVFVFAQWRGKPVGVVINRIPDIDISYGARGAQPANSVTLTRFVTIYNYPYVVQITLWRSVEG
ncbi:hypothetical protein IG193_03125 [Infirmifilum lucidum]|uniref:Uncharacterized protein n=1 Tax=Infirmifilum lucidum TaxID=2776706 RepID=A0A7L9FID9_9CREN|nr:hypothetical protein [Infirmifilum lucidum]QOJ79467.1 hypothetical protein IG193_03125 [Infirmifilum lucidum]